MAASLAGVRKAAILPFGTVISKRKRHPGRSLARGHHPVQNSVQYATMSRTVPFTEARSGLTELLDEIERVHEHVVITRNGRPSAVMMAQDEYDSLIETLEVLADQEAMGDLDASQHDVDAGRVFGLEDVKRARRRG
jgi:antitoxin YefM